MAATSESAHTAGALELLRGGGRWFKGLHGIQGNRLGLQFKRFSKKWAGLGGGSRFGAVTRPSVSEPAGGQ
jgi:hypothetical protein